MARQRLQRSVLVLNWMLEWQLYLFLGIVECLARNGARDWVSRFCTFVHASSETRQQRCCLKRDSSGGLNINGLGP